MNSSTAFGSWRNAGTDPSVLMFEVEGLTPNTVYKFEVRARNTAGTSPSLAITPAAGSSCDGRDDYATSHPADSRANSFRKPPANRQPMATPKTGSLGINWLLVLTATPLSVMPSRPIRFTGQSSRDASAAEEVDTTDWPADTAGDGDVQVIVLMQELDDAGLWHIHPSEEIDGDPHSFLERSSNTASARLAL